MEPVRFGPRQRQRLLALGLAPEQIEQLEIEALPIIRQWPRQRPSRTAILHKLDRHRAAIRRCMDSLEWLTGFDRDDLLRRSVNGLIPGGGTTSQQDGIVMKRAYDGLADTLAILDAAEAKLPPEPVRHRTASPHAIAQIYSSLQMGAIVAGLGPDVPWLRPSVSPTSPFWEVVCMCYRVVGWGSAEPERAIKAFVSDWRQLAPGLRVKRRKTGTERRRS